METAAGDVASSLSSVFVSAGSAETQPAPAAAAPADGDKPGNLQGEKKKKWKGPKPGKAAPAAAAAPTAPDFSASGLIPMIDIGVNLTDTQFTGEYHGKQQHASDRDEVLERAYAAGVAKIMITGGNLEESQAALDLARGDASGRLFSTVGVHPTRCSEFVAAADGPEAYLARLLALCEEGKAEGKVVAIGECGLDYDRLEFCAKEVCRWAGGRAGG